MNQNPGFLPSAMLLTLLGGASLGALAAVFLAAKTGQEGLNPLQPLARPATGNRAAMAEPDPDAVEMLFI